MIDFILAKAIAFQNLVDTLVKNAGGFGRISDEEVAGRDLIMYKVVGIESNGSKTVANVYGRTEKEALDTFKIIYSDYIFKSLSIEKAKDLKINF